MFHKENSSTITCKGKKSKDVPLRKSDRRGMRQLAEQQLFGNQDIPGSSHEADNEISVSVDSCDDGMVALLNDCFLNGTLLSREILLPSHKVTLYIRSPNEPATATAGRQPAGAASGQVDNHTSLRHWPYCVSQQCVWIQVKQPQQGGDIVWEVPSLPLMAALASFGLHFPFVAVPPQVSKYLCRGADLMRSGIVGISLPEKKTRGGVVAVMVTGNPQPFAVGLLSPSVSGASDVGPGTKGVAVNIVSCYGDDLWKQQQQPYSDATNNREGILNVLGGAPYDAGQYGNAGFLNGKNVVPITKSAPEEQDKQEQGSPTSEQGQSTATGDSTGLAPTGEINDRPEGTVAKAEPSSGQAQEQDATTDDPSGTEAATQEDQLSPEQVLHTAVCNALAKLHPKRKQLLPMTLASFYAQYVQPNRPPGTTIQLKQTKYKKFGPYVVEQVERGFLQVGPADKNNRKDPMSMLVDYDARHDDVRDLIKQRRSEAAAKGGDESNSTSGRKLVLVDLYVIPNHFCSLLRLDQDVVKAANATSSERRNTGMLTLKEASALLDDYITREELMDPCNPAMVRLDGPLTDALFKNKNKQTSSAVPDTLSRKDLKKSFQDRLESAYALVEMPGNHIQKLGRGKPPAVQIEVSRRQSNKFVTRVTGLEDFGIDAAHFAKDVAHRFACSSSIEDEANPNRPPLRKGHVEVVVGGNLVDELEALLLSDPSLTSHGGAKGSTYHLPKNAIQVTLRKGVPARKKRQSKNR